MTSQREIDLVFPVAPSSPRAAFVRRLGPDRLWGRDPAGAWRVFRIAITPVLARLAPGSAVYGLERIPRAGGLLIAANHFTALDPLFVAVASPRGVHFFAKGQLFERSLLTEAIRWGGSIPVGVRANSRAALRHATALLRAGRVVGIFVEGARQRSDELGEAMPGAALLALRAEVHVVPCGVATYGWSKRSRQPCTIVFGEPLRLAGGAGRAEVAQATEQIGRALERAWRSALDAAEAGRPGVLPDGARRRGWRDLWTFALTHRARP